MNPQLQFCNGRNPNYNFEMEIPNYNSEVEAIPNYNSVME
jgi:hypothetical protein